MNRSPFTILHLILQVKTRKKNSTTKNGNNKGGNNSSAANNAATNHDQLVTMLTNILTKAMIPGMWCIVASLLPFAAFQWFGFAVFCKLQKHELSKLPQSITSYGSKLNLTMPGDDLKPDWCHIDPPIPYFELGKQVGKMKKIEVKSKPHPIYIHTNVPNIPIKISSSMNKKTVGMYLP